MLALQPDKIIRSKRKTFALEINNQGLFILRAPQRATARDIDAVVLSHQAWINKKKQETLRLQKSPGQYFYLGKAYQLTLDTSAGTPLTLDNNFILHTDYQDQIDTVFKHWYVQQAKKIIPARLERLSNETGYVYKSVRFTKAKKYWGLCNADNVLSFSWQLMKGPLAMIDYVILHELVHTKIKNHSRVFWQAVAEVCPDYKRQERQLKEWQYK